MDNTITAATATPDGLDATGNCYYSNGMLMLGPGKYSKWTLVHGRPTLQIPPYVEFGHAWLESPDGQMVYDAERDFEIPKFLYYAVGNIDENDCFKYSRNEARKKMLEFGHYGPWEGPDAGPPIEIDYDEEDEDQ